MHSQLYIKLMNSVRWRRLRNEYLTQHPDCEECKRQGYIKPAQCVHHVTHHLDEFVARQPSHVCQSVKSRHRVG